MGDDLYTGEGSSVGSFSDSHLSYYGEKVNPDERPRLTGFMSDQIMEMGHREDEEKKSKKKIVGYQPENEESKPTSQGRAHRTKANTLLSEQVLKQSKFD